MEQRIIDEHLAHIYTGTQLDQARALFAGLSLAPIKTVAPPTQATAYLITYADAFTDGDQAPLAVLKQVVVERLAPITDVHILPMFPYTSDDGFAVTDYLAINPALGTWADVAALAADKRLMFDFVCNHMSKSADWFQRFLNHDPAFESAFIRYDPTFDASNTTRPRVSPLFHTYFNAAKEPIKAWTTFSEDQVDVNVQDPAMLFRLTQVLLTYIDRGASSIRLDAIGFMWKASGTTSMHQPQTHAIIQLWRSIIEQVAPHVQLITETNVPHAENIAYFGNGDNEANQVYQFPLPPLVLHTFLHGDSTKLAQWAAGIHRVSDSATYFNFLASHDGIGLRPTEGILTDAERQQLTARVVENGGKLSMKQNPDGSESVYEMNINYSEALRDPAAPADTPARMIAAHNILVSLVGVPAIYYHSIFGSKNDLAGVAESGMNRRINRQHLDLPTLNHELATDAYRQQIYAGITRLLTKRQQFADFDPHVDQAIRDFGPSVFAVQRGSICSVTNVTDQTVSVPLQGEDVLADQPFTGTLAPYQCAWVQA